MSDSETNDGPGMRIRRLRKAARLSQSDLARLVGVESQTISLYERGKITDPRMQTVAAIAAAFGVSVDLIVRGTEDSEPHVGAADEEASTAVRGYLDSLDPDDPRRPTEDEERWLEGLSFRDLRGAGLEVTPALLGRLLLERRAQEAGKLREPPEVPPPPTRKGRKKVDW